MAFESYPREDMEKLNDPGQVFVLEKRKLDRIAGWYMKSSFRKEKDNKSEEKSNEETDVSLTYVSPALTRQSSGLHTAPPLLTLCLDFVGAHVHHVESLVDFPEVVGKALFESAAQKGIFDNTFSQGTLSAMQLFSDAYGSLMLESANLENAAPHMSRMLPLMSTAFYSLTELNLFGCGLGENEDLLQHISHFYSLERLSLQHNHLTDTSVRIMTSPMRVLHKGPLHLQILDLSRNPRLTESSARYLSCFKELLAIDLSGTKYFSRGIQKLEDALSLEEDPEVAEFDSSYQYETWGWAAAVVRQWVVEAQKDLPLPSDGQDKSGISSFYGSKQTKASRFVCETREKTSTEAPPAEPVIRLGRPASGGPTGKGTPSLKTTSPEGQGEGARTNGNRSSRKRNPSCDASELIEKIHALDESQQDSVAAPTTQPRCATPTDSLLNCYLLNEKQEQETFSEEENRPKLLKIFSCVEDNARLTSENQPIIPKETIDVLKPDKGGLSTNPRKKRKIIVVRNKPSAPATERIIESRPTMVEKHTDKGPKRTSESSLWKAMSSSKW